jgi:hypothetical protein
MGKRPSASGFGITGPVAVVTGSGATDQVDHEMVKYLRRRRDLMTMQQITKLDEPSGQGQPVPPAISLTEMVQAGASIANLHKGVAETAMAEREVAERRAQRVTEDAEKRIEQAKIEERTQGGQVLQMFERFAAMSQENMKTNHETQLSLVKQVHESQLQVISAKVDGALDQFKAREAQKDQEIEQLRRQVAAANGRESIEDVLTKVLVHGQDDPRLAVIARLVGPTTNAADDPETIYRRGLAEVEVARAQRGLLAVDQDLRHKDERHLEVQQVIRSTKNLLATAHEWLPGIIGAVRGAGDKNGVPSGFENVIETEGGGLEDGTIE